MSTTTPTATSTSTPVAVGAIVAPVVVVVAAVAIGILVTVLVIVLYRRRSDHRKLVTYLLFHTHVSLLIHEVAYIFQQMYMYMCIAVETNIYIMYRLKHGFECHTGYNAALGRKSPRCHYSPYGARSRALTYL